MDGLFGENQDNFKTAFEYLQPFLQSTTLAYVDIFSNQWISNHGSSLQNLDILLDCCHDPSELALSYGIIKQIVGNAITVEFEEDNSTSQYHLGMCSRLYELNSSQDKIVFLSESESRGSKKYIHTAIIFGDESRLAPPIPVSAVAEVIEIPEP